MKPIDCVLLKSHHSFLPLTSFAMTRTSHPTSSCEEFKHVGSVLQWTSLTYEVRDRKTKDKKQLISDLSGSVRGGQMLAGE